MSDWPALSDQRELSIASLNMAMEWLNGFEILSDKSPFQSRNTSERQEIPFFDAKFLKEEFCCTVLNESETDRPENSREIASISGLVISRLIGETHDF